MVENIEGIKDIDARVAFWINFLYILVIIYLNFGRWSPFYLGRGLEESTHAYESMLWKRALSPVQISPLSH